MPYILLALLLIITGTALLVIAALKNELTKSSKITFGTFIVVGAAMAVFAMQEIGQDRYHTVQEFKTKYPQLQSEIEQYGSTIRMYEYLEIVELCKAAQK